MKGEYSTNKFFIQFPKIIPKYFQGSYTTKSIDIENLFNKAEKTFQFFKIYF